MSEVKNIPEGWVETTLGEITNYINRGITPQYSETDGIYVLNQRCIRDNKVSFENARLHDIHKKNVTTEKNIQTEDILICSTGVGTLGRVAQIKKISKLTTVDSHVTIVRPNKKVDNLFLGFFLRNKEKEIEHLAEGSTGQTELPRKKLEAFDILMPKDFKEQKTIADILMAFDDKIELLQAQNKTLEETAQTIFAEWFGKFQINDELPDGYKFGALKDVALNHSKTFKFTHENVVFINTGDVSEGQFLHSNEISPIGLPGQAKKSIELYDILYSEIRPKNKRFAFVDFDTSNYVVSTKFMIIRPKNDFSPFILYLILKNQETIDEFNIVAESRSGTFPQITFDAVKSFPILIPNKEKQNDFDNILTPIMEKKKLNHQQIQTLTKTRDELLPRLMSGQVRVKM